MSNERRRDSEILPGRRKRRASVARMGYRPRLQSGACPRPRHSPWQVPVPPAERADLPWQRLQHPLQSLSLSAIQITSLPYRMVIVCGFLGRVASPPAEGNQPSRYWWADQEALTACRRRDLFRMADNRRNSFTISD